MRLVVDLISKAHNQCLNEVIVKAFKWWNEFPKNKA